MSNVILTLSKDKYSIQIVFEHLINSCISNYKIGDILINFYEIDLNLFFSIINNPIQFSEKDTPEDTIERYIGHCIYVLSDFFDPTLCVLMLNAVKDDLLNTDLQDNEELNIKINETFVYFVYLKRFIESYADGELENLKDFNKLVLSQQAMTAKYYLSEQNELSLGFVIDNIETLIALELINLKSNNIPIKRCANCKKVFLPVNRSDEIYCDRIFKNGKTCKELGYSEKVKNDVFKQMYTKARKTQHARIRYNNHIPDYKEKHYEPWKKAAEQARDEFKTANDIDGFEKWLNEHKNSF